MKLLPDLGRLSLRPCPTGVDPPPLSAANTEGEGTPARDAVVTNNDLLVLIFTALNGGARDDACQQVQRWCATHKGACNDDTWRRARDLLFPRLKDSAPNKPPKLHLLQLCRRWNRGRYDRYVAAITAAKGRGDLVIPLTGGSYTAEEHDSRHYKAIKAFLLNAHRFDMDNEGDHGEMPDAFSGYDVYWFCAWALEFNREPLKWAIEAGYIHLRHNLVGPSMFWTFTDERRGFYNGEPFCFFSPKNLLGLAILWPTDDVLDTVKFVLDFGHNPNATGIEPFNFVHGNVLVRDDVLRPKDEGGIESLALYHIVHLLHNTHRFTGTYYKRHVRVYPGLANMPTDLKPLYELLHRYGAEMLKAAIMYRAYHLFTQNPVLLEYSNYLLQLSKSMWELQRVSKAQVAQWFKTALTRARARFPYIIDEAFDENGNVLSLGVMSGLTWDDLEEPEPLPAPRTPTREEVDGFLRDDVYEMDDMNSGIWQELPNLNEVDEKGV